MKVPTALLLALLAPALAAQEAAKAKDKPEAIQDNSFLVEEAYNQEDGVVQHISTWQRFKQTRDWAYTFTQEWPAAGQTHQLSYTLPLLRVGSLSNPQTGLGDIYINYRYQAVGSGDADVAFSPRLSVILPTGDYKKGMGTSATGLQVMLPVSVVLGPALVSHSNAGATWTPKAKSPEGDRADLSAWSLGQSFVWLAHERFNVMLETVYGKAQAVAGPGKTEWGTQAFVSPSVRWAYNLAGGLQIVPGLAFPIGIGPCSKERAVFLYLSFEHPFRKAK